MKIEKVILRNEWWGISLLYFYLHPETPMINLSYNVHAQSPDFQLFQNWNHFNYSLCIRELKVKTKFDQDDRMMGVLFFLWLWLLLKKDFEGLINVILL